MVKVSQLWFRVQEVLFPFLESKFESPLTEKLKKLVTTLELVGLKNMFLSLFIGVANLQRIVGR